MKVHYSLKGWGTNRPCPRLSSSNTAVNVCWETIDSFLNIQNPVPQVLLAIWCFGLGTHSVMESLNKVMHIILLDLHDAGLEPIVPGTSLDLLSGELETSPKTVLDDCPRFLWTCHTHHEIRWRTLRHNDQRPCLFSCPSPILAVYINEERSEFPQGHRLCEQTLIRLTAANEGVSKVFEQCQAPFLHHRHSLLNDCSLEGHAQWKTLLENLQALPRQGIISCVEAVDPSIFVIILVESLYESKSS